MRNKPKTRLCFPNGGFITFNGLCRDMNYVVKGLLLVVAVFLLFWALQTAHHWVAIAVLLVIIFYGLFANPMGKVHAEMETEKPRFPRKKKKRSK